MDGLGPRVRTLALGGLLAITLAACRTTGQKPDYIQPTPSPTPSPSPSGPTTYASTAFVEPFTITRPAGWLVGYTQPDVENIYLPMGPNEGPRSGIDVEEVGQVLKDPCGHGPNNIDIGPSPQDLATWMAGWAPLHAAKAVPGKVAGHDALIVEEAFDGSCDGPNLWPNPGGYLDPAEHKRYAIFEVGGKRVIATIVGRDDTWEATLPDAEKVLDSLTFTNP